MATAWRSVLRVVEALYIYRNHFIRWPTEQEIMENAARVRRDWGIPGVGGMLDATHIEIPLPSREPRSYINRKKYPSLQLQVKKRYHSVKFYL